MTSRAAGRTLELVGRAARSAALSVDPHCHRYSSAHWLSSIVTPQQLDEQVLNAWCGGDRKLASRVLAGAYVRYLPWRVLRSLCWTLFLAALAASGALLVLWDWPWLVVKIVGILLLLTVLLGSLLFVQRPACLVRTASATSQHQGLLDARVHQAALSLGWRNVRASRVTTPMLGELLKSQGAPDGVLETALKLHSDGWDGTCGELYRAAEML